jgi:homopolymeric O-antigen transport system ATP-binding protein
MSSKPLHHTGTAGESGVAIHARGLGKQYEIGRAERYKTLRDTIVRAVQAPFRRLLPRAEGERRSRAEKFWALKDVSFDVRPGEIIGIIGRNGAGKSTLLKILSRITAPTEGRAEIHGRVSSLLEVGTGFHGELTGRENLYLNGAILGMRRTEIDLKFDEIVSFAEVERFIDMPVKHYSSGMYLRLAFAVAAHLEPEILIVDEVLAVGDARFQKKCLNKMEDAGHGGRTVLFVSHNMPAITRLCPRAILLDAGSVLQDGPAHQVVGAYLKSGLGTSAAREWNDPQGRPGDEVANLVAVRVRSEDGRITDVVDIRRPVRVEMEYEVGKPGYVLTPHFGFNNEDGVRAFSAVDLDPEWRRRPRPVGRYVTSAWIPGNLLAEGTLFVMVGLFTMAPRILQFQERDVVAFQVVDTLDGDSARGDLGGKLKGVVRPMLKWSTEYRGEAVNASSQDAEARS